VAADEADQSAEDVIEAVAESRVDVRDVAESFGDLEAGEDLAEGTERSVIASGLFLPRL
jgi:hypothetical protein